MNGTPTSPHSISHINTYYLKYSQIINISAHLIISQNHNSIPHIICHYFLTNYYTILSISVGPRKVLTLCATPISAHSNGMPTHPHP